MVSTQNGSLTVISAEGGVFVSPGAHSRPLDCGVQRPIVFIGGLHRSGTTLLARILGDHPEISGFRNTGAPEDEGQHLQSVYPAAREFGGPGVFGFHPEAPLDDRSPLASRGNAEKLFREWSCHWDLNRKLLVEKSPPNLIRARFLQSLFPQARFILLMRHPIAVACATTRFSRRSIPQLVEHWLMCNERFFDDRKHLRRWLVVRYENLVTSPDATMEIIYRFLEVPAVTLRQEIRPGLDAAYMQHYRQSSNRAEIHGLVERFGARVRRLGYDLAGPEAV